MVDRKEEVYGVDSFEVPKECCPSSAGFLVEEVSHLVQESDFKLTRKLRMTLSFLFSCLPFLTAKIIGPPDHTRCYAVLGTKPRKDFMHAEQALDQLSHTLRPA